MSMNEKQLKDAAKAALPELQAITIAVSKVTNPDSAVLQGLTEAFEFGYTVGYTSGRATIFELAEAVAAITTVLKP